MYTLFFSKQLTTRLGDNYFTKSYPVNLEEKVFSLTKLEIETYIFKEMWANLPDEEIISENAQKKC